DDPPAKAAPGPAAAALLPGGGRPAGAGPRRGGLVGGVPGLRAGPPDRGRAAPGARRPPPAPPAAAVRPRADRGHHLARGPTAPAGLLPLLAHDRLRPGRPAD